MATQLQLRKGTKVQNDMFTGAEAELTYDSTSKGLRLHDGIQQGGYEVPVLVAVQRPTAENNYTWFRVWSDGWVEQGGRVQLNGAISATNKRITFPVVMANTQYTAGINNNTNVGSVAFIGWESTTGMSIGVLSGSNTGWTSWQVSGMAA